MEDEKGNAAARIEQLQRRVKHDPTSIAFAALAEEYRRVGRHQDAVDACRAGLERHPAYLSARVTLGRALIELGALDEAMAELERVRRSAPENLAAIRGLAEIHHRRGEISEAAQHYKSALDIVGQAPEALPPAVASAGRRALDAVTAGTAGPDPAPTVDHAVVAELERFLDAILAARAAAIADAPPA